MHVRHINRHYIPGALLCFAVDARESEDVRRAHIRADDQAGAEIGPEAAVLVALQGGLVVRRVVRLVRVSAKPAAI